MDEQRIQLGEAESEHDIRQWLADRIRAPHDALDEGEQVAYGSIEDPKAVWLGVARSGRLRAAQRLFRGRLVREGDGWFLVGRMALPVNGLVRIAMLAVFGVVVIGVSVKFLIAGGWLAVGDLVGLGVGVCLLGGAVLVHRGSVRGAQEDLVWLREHLGRDGARGPGE